MIVIPQFEHLARVSTKTFGGEATSILVVREDVDTITGSALNAEADRVAQMLMER